ncbi:hypothetical protein [Leptospira interrogans]|uniref:hypothetical protein n=1 Tax=Leptospira interrogans TaxID=173 RepID=UPI00031AAE32|nr:hypothetical protein [Leptospira interrogans]
MKLSRTLSQAQRLSSIGARQIAFETQQNALKFSVSLLLALDRSRLKLSRTLSMDRVLY